MNKSLSLSMTLTRFRGINFRKIVVFYLLDDLGYSFFTRLINGYTVVFQHFDSASSYSGTNNGIDFLRKKRLKLLSIDDTLEKDGAQDFSNNLKSTALDPEERYIRQQRKLIMRDLLNKLSDKYRVMIELRFFEELSYQEISEQLSLPIGTVKAQLFRAKELLYDVLSKSKAGNSL